MKDYITVLCYGDSNTYGFKPETAGRYEKSKRWTTLLQQRLGNTFEVVAEGLNGRTTAFDRADCVWKNGLTYFPAIFETHKPVDVLVFMLGTNDCMGEYDFSVQTIADGMQQLVEAARTLSHSVQGFEPQIVLVAPAAIASTYKSSPFKDITEASVEKSHALGPLYRRLAEKLNCQFLDATESIEVSAFDSVHLSEAGHAQLAAALEPCVRQAALQL